MAGPLLLEPFLLLHLSALKRQLPEACESQTDLKTQTEIETEIETEISNEMR